MSEHLLRCIRVCVYILARFVAECVRVTLCVVWVVRGCLVFFAFVFAGACVLIVVRCGLSCSSVVACGVYVGVVVWAFASMLLQLVDSGQLQLHHILACHYGLYFVMLLFISGVCLRCSGASLGLSVSSARILPMLFVWRHNCILAFVVALLHLIFCISI